MKLMDITIYAVYIATYSIIIPVAIGIYFFKELTKPLKIVLAGLCVALILDVLLFFFDPRRTNTFLYFFSAVDILTLSWALSSAINNRKISKIFLAIGVLFIPLIIADAFFISGLANNGYSNAAEKLVVFGLSIYYLSDLFNNDFETKITQAPLFWICIGVIAYDLTGTFDVFSKPIMNYSQNLYLQYYIFWSLVTVFMYIAFGRAFLLCKHNAYK